ncbi:flagellar hook-length control protein FliK [Amphibacillus cookii]|uniref:flagellar hook-length control protein FliK n=1 Tax=Amphibacillus cookii TaxID=767787 RepID=UPI00195EF387|nr:flagellar hook-length control protein FliK [Amphibacillus cookii]MBM7540574.1 flagellar hook-length control protein FliK [Amphibacillus cookii]
MNINALLFNHTVSSVDPIRSKVTADHKQTNVSFGQLLGSSTPLSSEILTTKEELVAEASDSDKWSEFLQSLDEEELDHLFAWFQEKTGETITDIEGLVEAVKLVEEQPEEIDDDLVNQFVSLWVPEPPVSSLPTEVDLSMIFSGLEGISDLTLDFSSLKDSIEQLISHFDELNQNEAKQLLVSLKQWTEVAQSDATLTDQFINDNEHKPHFKAFLHVLNNYQNKELLSQRTTYQADTTVTSEDVMKWVKAAVARHNNPASEQSSNFGALFNQQQGHTTIEQLAVHLNSQTETVDQLSEQLMSKLEQALEQSTFLQGKNGTNQLLIKLAPESLGNIMVELTEIDGEMLVKLTASSQMAKEALEANIRELRHMFSPQNVVVEKQEDSSLILEQQSPHDHFNDEQDAHEHEQEAIYHQQDQQDESETSFEDILFNERV